VYDQTFSIDDKILSRICDKILCRIYDQINTLTVEQYSIKRVLRAANYPQLYSLSLINFEGKILNQYLTGKIFNYQNNELDKCKLIIMFVFFKL
jgi:hypothetical protein